MTQCRLSSLKSLAVFCFAAPILAACGTPAVAGNPDSMTVYSNGKPIAQVLTSIPVTTSPGVDMSSLTATATANEPPTVSAPTSTLPPTLTLPPSATAHPTQTDTQVASPTPGQPATNSSGSTPVLPAGTAELVAQLGLPVNGDPVNGQKIFSQVGCSACHDVANGVTIVGPSLKGVAARAATRKTGYSAIAYLRESILYPNAYVVQNFNPNIMPQTFGQQLTKQQIDDVVSYLLTLGN